MGLYALTMMGIMPLGTMLLGVLGSVAGVPTVLIACGALTAAASVAILIRARKLHALA